LHFLLIRNVYKTKNTPKVVGGITPNCTDVAAALYEAILEAPIHKVSSPAVAEMEKILENTYRNVNIGLVNELAILSNKMGINFWEVVDAAKSKPYGFQAFYPGPGLGGHCIPLDPYYLSWKAREYGFHTSMIESSMMINDRMPEYCAERSSKILNRFKKAVNGSKILFTVFSASSGKLFSALRCPNKTTSSLSLSILVKKYPAVSFDK